MRACKTILTIIFLLTCGTALAQDDARLTITLLERSVSEGTATRAQQLDLARAYMSTGRYYEAGKIAKRLIAADANDADAIALRDKSQEQLRGIAQQRVTDAESAASRASATDADRLELANAYFGAGEYRKAADLYAKLPDAVMTPAMRHNHARALTWSGQHDASERIYARLVAEQPTPELEIEYGRVLSWMGATDAAIKRLNAAYAANRSEEAALALANAHTWSANRDAAIRLLDEYTASSPNATEAAALLEQLRTSPELRIERIDKAIELDPYNLALRVQRARLLYDAGRYSEALKTIEFVNEHAPTEIRDAAMTSSTTESLSTLENQLRDRRKERVAELDARLATMNIDDPAIADDVLQLAKGFTGQGAYPQSLRLYEAYLKNVPNDKQARQNYARVLSWSRRYDDAQDQYARLLREDPDRADLRLEYAQALSYDEEYVPAMRTFHSLTDLSSNPRGYLYSDVPARAHYSRGQIYRWFGWREHAVMEQNSALEIDNEFLPAREELFRARTGRPSTQFDARYTYATNSNDFTLKRVDLDAVHWLNNRAAVEGSVGRHNFEYRGSDVNASAASVGGRFRQTDRLTLRGRVGGTFYDEGLGARPFWALGAQFLPNLQSRLALDYNHYDLVYDAFTLQSLTIPAGGTTVAIDDPISINDFRAHYDWNSGGFWSFLVDGSYGLVSDDNRRAAGHGLLTFRLWNRPFVAVKADGRVLSYDFRSNRYWSPDDYKSLAGVLQIGQNVRDRFYWNVEGKAGKSWEGSRSSDIRSIAGSVTVPVTELFDVVGHYGYGKSGRFDDLIGGSGSFTNYWQRNWYVGVRVKRLYAGDDRRGRNPYYYDDRPITGSTVIPPEVQ